MNLIRGFLWTLVGVMTLQGFYHADEYGVATSMIGGVGLTLSVWRESIAAGAQSLWSSQPKFIPLPRVIVQAALKETALHPGIQVVPRLQQTLTIHQRVWELLREKEVQWLLQHADLIGGVLSDPEARQLWTTWDRALNRSEVLLANVKPHICKVRILNPEICDNTAFLAEKYERDMRIMKEVVDQWTKVLNLNRWGSSVRGWWVSMYGPTSEFDQFEDDIARLHDIANPDDPRVIRLMGLAQNITDLLAADKSEWLRRLLHSLLIGELWSGCLEHVRLREGRVRELMVIAGIQDMINAQERILNASLRVVSTVEEKRLVHDWFGEMLGYAWFPPDELPSLVRRCISQDAGDCTRIGPTEIVTLTAKVAERERIIGDWVRRVFIGLWNAIPVVGILFLVELVVLCIELRHPVQASKSYVVKLDQGQRQMVLSER
jgi:hypothetical protein